MKVAITANGTNLDATTNPLFGRCPIYLFVDTETMAFEAVDNPAISASGGAGIQAAQFVVEHGAQAVLTGNMGPNAANVFQAADVPVYQVSEEPVRQALEKFRQGRLGVIGETDSPADNTPAHPGRGGRRRIRSRQGAGHGRGRGGDIQAAPPPTPSPQASGQEELVALRQTVSDLSRQLTDVMDRLEQLDNKEGH